ncbi:MAG: hypothetical protein JXC85_02825 [Candidatus Aenigmarchaeota archaeon]|nr:hypothetical protein [Candidatus Aenigmarchaeota archaeon]
MFGLSKKKQAGGPAPAGPRIPTEKVVSLSSQGLSEPEIIKTLREEGFSPLEVDRAMKDALRTGTGVQAPPYPRPGRFGPPSPPPLPGTQPGSPLSAPPAPAPPPTYSFQDQPPIQQPGMPPSYPQQNYMPSPWTDDDLDEDMEDLPKERRMGPGAFMDDLDAPLPHGPRGGAIEKEPLEFEEPLPKRGEDRVRELKDRRRREVEELTEEVTEEKWSEMMSRVNALEGKIDDMASGVKSAADQVPGAGVPPQEIESIRKDIEEQKHVIEDTNARIDSLEEIVKGSLTPMVESIRKFSHAVKASKKGEPVTIEQPREEPKAPAPPSAMPPRPKPQSPYAPPE